MLRSNYSNFISLGYFCGVAEDLERIGLRSFSSPFDWLITDFKGVIKLIENRFENFMAYENLLQSTETRSHYLDQQYSCFFFHDFSAYKSLNDQYEKVKTKYQRRIERFLKSIEQPTLFIRYISNEEIKNNRSVELEWIEKNDAYILAVLREYNPLNSIVYIADENVQSDKIKIYHVIRDENDVVSRHPICNNAELSSVIKNYSIPEQEANIRRFEQKHAADGRLKTKILTRIRLLFERYFYKAYIHSKEYSIPTK